MSGAAHSEAGCLPMPGSAHTKPDERRTVVRMLHEFLSSSRDDLIDRCRLKVAQRRAPKVTDSELEHGIPLFLDQVIKTLYMERLPQPMRSREVSGPSGGGPVTSEIGA